MTPPPATAESNGILVDPAEVERIEILRGKGGVRYGQQDAQPPPEQHDEQDTDGLPDMGQDNTVFEVGAPFRVKKISTAKDRQVRRGSGRRSRSRVSQKQGRYSRASLSGGVKGDIALDATIRAAALHQQSRSGHLAIKLAPEDVHYKIREKRIGNLLLFVVDASNSMGARGRMATSKGAVMSLLLDAYQKRDKVSMVSFRRQEAFVNLPITNSVELAGKLLAEMPVGGRTPLNAGLVKGYEQVRNYLIREPTARPIVIIITDGKTNVSLGGGKPVDEMLKLARKMTLEKQIKYIVVDTEEEGLVTFDLSKKLALALEAGLSGVLIRGEKGTAKSTAVRALAEIMPMIEVIEECPFQLDPESEYETHVKILQALGKPVPSRDEITSHQRKVQVIELPVGATEDRVVGTLDLEHALKKGEKRVEPGLLAQAHRGILYVDEVNLLDDHVVDVLLDAAAMGVNTIERECISFSHPARFTLVGTMNPEEGELRPQLLDRFGLCVNITGIGFMEERVAIMERRIAFDENPAPPLWTDGWNPQSSWLLKL